MADAAGSHQQAGDTAQQAATFLTHAVHSEVDGAQVGPVRVLRSDDGQHVYAAAVVHGPLRAYLATAWGAAGGVSRKEIVSYPDPAAAQAALDAAVARQQRQGYTDQGTVDGAG